MFPATADDLFSQFLVHVSTSVVELHFFCALHESEHTVEAEGPDDPELLHAPTTATTMAAKNEERARMIRAYQRAHLRARRDSS
jgi:hypothetical protein